MTRTLKIRATKNSIFPIVLLNIHSIKIEAIKKNKATKPRLTNINSSFSKKRLFEI